MSTDFSKFQKNVCDQVEQPPPLKKICSPCQPNPDFVEPNWTMMLEEPFYNEKTCEYMVCLSVDENMKAFELGSNTFPSEPLERSALLRKYKHPAIVMMLEHYGKMIATQIICAAFDGPTVSGKTAEELLQGYDNYETVFDHLSRDPLTAMGIYGNIEDMDIKSKPCGNIYGTHGHNIEQLLEENTDEDNQINMSQMIMTMMSNYESINNPYALELYAYVKDYDLFSGYLKVLVAIPSFIFDAVPDAPGRADLAKEAMTTVDEVELTITDLFGQITRLTSALMVYSKYQSHFYQTQAGFVQFDNEALQIMQVKEVQEGLPKDKTLETPGVTSEGTLEGEDLDQYATSQTHDPNAGPDAAEEPKPIDVKPKNYYANMYSSKIWDFWKDLKTVAKANGYSIGSFSPSVVRKTAEKVKIRFESTDKNKPYKLKEIRAKQRNCPYETFGKELSVLEKHFEDQTLMNYIAKLKEIDVALSAKESYPWLDFLVKFTYPLLTVNYGQLNLRAVEETVGSCVSDNALEFSIDLRDYILDEVLNLHDVFAYEYNTKSCTVLKEQDDAVPPLMEPDTPDTKKKTRSGKAKREAKEAEKAEILKAKTEAQTKISSISGQISGLRTNAGLIVDQADKHKEYLGYMNEITRLEEEIEKLEETIGPKKDPAKLNKKDRQKAREKGRVAKGEERNPYSKKARELAMVKISGMQDSILTSMLDFSTFESQGFGGIKFKKGQGEELVGMSGKLSLCAVKSLTLQGINCLFSGVTEDVAVDKIVRATLKAMEIDVFGFFTDALPPAVQVEVREALEKEFGDLPMPWEEGYASGDYYNSSNYQKYLGGANSSRGQSRLTRLECEEKYYQALQNLPDVEEGTRPALIEETYVEEAAQLKIAMEECISGDGAGFSTPEPEVVDEDEEIPLTEQEIQGLVERQPVLSTDDRNQYSMQWSTYIEQTVAKDRGTEAEAAAVRDAWFEYTAFPAAKAAGHIPSYTSWQEWWHIKASSMGSEPSPLETSNLIQNEIAPLSAAFATERERKIIALRTESDVIRARIEENNKNKEGLNALRDAMAGLSEEQIESGYARLQSGERVPLGGDPDNRGTPGTFGAAFGNAQELIINAYIDVLMDTVNADQILGILDRFPGAQIIGGILADYRCAYQGAFKPPIKSFLSTLSLETCGGWQAGLALPAWVGTKDLKSSKYGDFKGLIPNFNKNQRLINRLGKAFASKFEDVLIEVMKQILVKLFQVLDEAICNSLNAIGKGLGATFSPTPLDDAMADAFCPDADPADLRNIQDNLFKASGVDDNIADSSFDCLYRVLNSTVSYGQYIDLFVNDPGSMDPNTLRIISDLVNTFCPEFSPYLGTPGLVGDLFGQASNYIPPEVSDYLQNAQPEENRPLYDAICLTQEDWDAWNQDREDLLTSNGVDEETARNMVNRANDRAEKDLGELTDLMEKSPEGLLGDAINKMMQPQDPTCAVSNGGILVYEDDALAEQKADLMKSVFDQVERTFFQDLIQRPRAVFNNILRDTFKSRLRGHELRVNMPWMFANYTNSEKDWEEREADGSRMMKLLMDKDRMKGMFPETVGIWMKNQLELSKLYYTTQISRSVSDPLKDPAEITISFQDNNNGDGGDPEYSFDLKYYVNHTKAATKEIGIVQNYWMRLRKRERKKLGLDSDPDGSTVLIKSVTVKPNVAYDGKYDNFDYNQYSYFYPYQMLVFKSLLENKINSPIESIAAFKPIYEGINSTMVNFASTAILNTPGGDIPTGFKFGYDINSKITFLDLLYVDPESNPNDASTWKYTKDEEEQVLGKSATENPRVHFLDPAIHGGTYKRPQIYIEPATHKGWFGMMRTFVQEVEQCESEDTGFLDVSGLAKDASVLEKEIPMDERLETPFYCRMEPPYDKIASPATHGIMSSVVIATIRVLATEFILKTMPVFSSVEFSDLNIDNTFVDLLMDEIERELSSQTTWWNIVQGYTYYLLFLEQAVQTAQRDINKGRLEKTGLIQAAEVNINDAMRLFDPKDKDQYIKGAALLGFGKDWRTVLGDTLNWKDTVQMTKLAWKMKSLSLFKINLAARVNTIDNSRESAKVFLRALVEREMKLLIDKMSYNLRPRPHIQNINKYLLSRNGILFSSDLKSGEMPVEQPVFEGSTVGYGNINNVVRDVNTESPLDGVVCTLSRNNFSPPDGGSLVKFLTKGSGELITDIGVDVIKALNPLSDSFDPSLSSVMEETPQLIRDYLQPKLEESVSVLGAGFFYIEKFLRVREKNGTEQVYAIDEFQEILRNRDDLESTSRISDYYGDALVQDGKMLGSIGIKFGVRLCFVPPPSVAYQIPDNAEQERTYRFSEKPIKIRFTDSFYEDMQEVEDLFGTIPGICGMMKLTDILSDIEIELPGLNRAIPVVTFEQDVLDQKIEDLQLDDPNFGEDLKCYVDNLVETEDYKLLFDFCFPIRSYISMYGIYSYYAFFPSLGEDPTELDPDPPEFNMFLGFANDKWRSKIFKATKKLLRRLFNSTYRTDDDVEEERKKRNKADYASFLKNLVPQGFLNLDFSVKWWQSYRIVDAKPFDADGKDCKNEFQKIFD